MKSEQPNPFGYVLDTTANTGRQEHQHESTKDTRRAVGSCFVDVEDDVLVDSLD
jgi:hypothetical protein